MADLKIDEAKAVSWTKDVVNEVVMVKSLLKEVQGVRLENVGENDTVFQLVEKAGNMMDEAWTTTCDAFEKGWTILQEGLDVFGKAGIKIDEVFKELGNIIKRGR